MVKFGLWTVEELREAIIGLEQAEATGASSVSYSGGGTVSYTLRENMQATLKELYAAYNRLVHGVVEQPAIQRVRIISKRGW